MRRTHIRVLLAVPLALAVVAGSAVATSATAGLWRRSGDQSSGSSRDLLSGLPREVELTSAEIRTAIASPLAEILDAVHGTLEITPPELAGDIVRYGILLAGGGSLLRAFGERVEAETGMRAHLADSPLTCVAVGAGHALEEADVLWGVGGRRPT